MKTDISVINNLKGCSDDKYIATAHESLLIYGNKNFVTYGVSVPEKYEEEYKLSDKNGNIVADGKDIFGSDKEKPRTNQSIFRREMWKGYYQWEVCMRQQFSELEQLQEKADGFERVKQYVGADKIDAIVTNAKELERVR